MQEVKISVSSAHSKVVPIWLDEKVNVASVLSVASSGPERMDVSGGAKTVQLYVAGVGSMLPFVSLARTINSCSPTERFVSCIGATQELKDGPSNAHSKVEPGLLDENVKSAVVLSV